MSKEISLLASDDDTAVRSTINLIQTPVYLIDVAEDGTFHFFVINESEERIVGYKNEVARGKRLEDILDPDFAKRREDALRQCLDTRSAVGFENYIDTTDGRRWGRTTLVPLFDEDGRLIRIMGTAVDITEERRARKELSESAELMQRLTAHNREQDRLFEHVFRDSSFGMGLVGLDFRTTKANEALCRMLGYSEGELKELGFDGVTHPDDRAEELEQVQRLFRGDIQVNAREKRYIRKDGSIMWGHVTSSVVRDEQGEALFGLGMVMDISVRKQAEETARKSTSLFEEAERIAGFGSWEMDLETNTIYCSQESRRIYGLPLDRALFSRDEGRNTVHPEDRVIPLDAYHKLLETGEPIQVEYRLQAKDGAIKYL